MPNQDRPNAPDVLALEGLDPVLLTQGKRQAGLVTLTVARKGFRYRFARGETRALFLTQAGRYEVQLDGHCARMPRVPGNPALFAVFRERIYLFGSPECREIFLKNPAAFIKPRRKVAIVLYPGVELLDFAGPGEVFSAADEGRAFHVYTVAATTRPLVSQGFVTVTPQYDFAHCPPPEILVLPGGGVNQPLQDPATMRWLRTASASAQVTFSVCNGALLLASLGLLEGKEATTHHGALEALRQLAPHTRVRDDRRFVDNGRIVTSAGVSAGIDGALSLVQRLLGADVARETARYMEYRWEIEISPGGRS